MIPITAQFTRMHTLIQVKCDTMEEITQELEDDDLGFPRTKSRRKKDLQVDISGEHIFDVYLAAPASPGPCVRCAFADGTNYWCSSR